MGGVQGFKVSLTVICHFRCNWGLLVTSSKCQEMIMIMLRVITLSGKDRPTADRRTLVIQRRQITNSFTSNDVHSLLTMFFQNEHMNEKTLQELRMLSLFTLTKCFKGPMSQGFPNPLEAKASESEKLVGRDCKYSVAQAVQVVARAQPSPGELLVFLFF